MNSYYSNINEFSILSILSVVLFCAVVLVTTLWHTSVCQYLAVYATVLGSISSKRHELFSLSYGVKIIRIRMRSEERSVVTLRSHCLPCPMWDTK